MSMTKQPEGMTRVRRGAARPPQAFEIFYTDPGRPGAERVKVGETRRHGRKWHAISPHAPDSGPLDRHNDAMAYLKGVHLDHLHRESAKLRDGAQATEAESVVELSPGAFMEVVAEAPRNEGGHFGETESVRAIPVDPA